MADDFFPNDGRTRVVRPTPGRTDWLDEPAAPPPEPAPATPDFEPVGDNPLVAAAVPLLCLVPGLAGSVDFPNVPALRQRLVDGVNEFNQRLRQRRVAPEQAWRATYAVCSLLDETIQKTGWGQRGLWARDNLVGRFRNNQWAGEEFFDIVDRVLLKHPEQNQHLVELYYLCLSLDFKGLYGERGGGQAELDKYRKELYLLIGRRGEEDRALSPRWQGIQDARARLMKSTPGWVLAAVALAVLVLAYAGFLFNLDSEPARRELAKLPGEAVKLAGPLPRRIEPSPPPQAERLQALQDRDTEFVDGNILRIRNAFEKGSAQIKDEFMPQLQRIAKELAAGQNTVQVSGHTDDVPIHTFRFPSNWELSKARAETVAKVLADNGVAPGKVETRGMAEDDPLPGQPGDTPETRRARNRRVDILLIR